MTWGDSTLTLSSCFSWKLPLLATKHHPKQKIVHTSGKTYNILLKQKVLEGLSLLLFLSKDYELQFLVRPMILGMARCFYPGICLGQPLKLSFFFRTTALCRASMLSKICRRGSHYMLLSLIRNLFLFRVPFSTQFCVSRSLIPT